MAPKKDEDAVRAAKLRLCRLKKWTNYTGMGFALGNTVEPPHHILSVDSNSPSAAAGLRIRDVILAVNKEDTTKVSFDKLKEIIRAATTKQETLELLVIEKSKYDALKKDNIALDRKYAQVLETPNTMPADYANFPKNTPRTCNIRLGPQDPSLGFELVTGERDQGAYVQDVAQRSPASQAQLRKSDRIIEVDDEFVDDKPYTQIVAKMRGAKANGGIKLYVMDTGTYKYYKSNGMPLESTAAADDDDDDDEQTANGDRVGDDDDDDQTSDVAPPVQHRGQPQSAPNDIRLCSITKTNSSQQFGVALNYDKNQRYHSLKIIPGANNEPSRAYVAGVREGDRLIEINDENVQNMEDTDVKQRIRAIKYPDPLVLLVASPETADYYSRTRKVITSDLANPRRGTDSTIGRGVVPPSVVSREIAGYPGISGLTQGNPLDIHGRPSARSDASSTQRNTPTYTSAALPPNHRRVALRSRPDFNGLGFGLNTKEVEGTPHKCINIKSDSPAERLGLRNGDCIVSINGQDCKDLDRNEVLQLMKDASAKEKNNGQPVVMVITDERYYHGSSPPAGNNNDTTILPDSSDDDLPPPTRTPVRSPSPPLTTVTLPKNPQSGSSAENRRPIENDYRGGPTTTAYPNRTASGQPESSQYRQPRTEDNYRPDSVINGTMSSNRSSRAPPSRTAVDVISGKFLLRYYTLRTQAGQSIGFKLALEKQKHLVAEVTANSPAAQAGLNPRDEIVEINDEYVAGRSHSDVTQMIRAAGNSGLLRLLVQPSNVKLLTERSKESFPLLDYYQMQRDSTFSTSLDDISQSTLRSKQGTIRPQLSTSIADLPNGSADPTHPLPRRCAVRYDGNFRGCGFRVIEKERCDTPVVSTVSPNSPAQRSGLAVGDHIIYIGKYNVQKILQFDEKVDTIRKEFNAYREVTLVVLSGAAYRVLKRRGGLLDPLSFDYRATQFPEMKPRLYNLSLYDHEQDFGLALYRENPTFIREIAPGSAADASGIERNDKILEIDGQDTTHLSAKRIQELLKESQLKRKLNILVIDAAGYAYSIKHAIPINSHLPLVRKIPTSNDVKDRQIDGSIAL